MAETVSTCDSVTTVEQLHRLLADQDPAAEAADLSHDDWENVAVLAIALGLAPVLHWKLEQSSICPPALTMAKLGVTRQAHNKRNGAIADQLSEILAGCRAQQISVIVLKGALLAQVAYPEPGLRPMNDIDLLLPARELPGFGRLLADLGYQGNYKDASFGPGITKHLSTYRRQGSAGATPNPYLSADGDRTVEPHNSLEESWFGLKVDITPGVWERSVPISLHGQPALRLCADDMLVHLAVHAAFHVIMRTTVFVQLYDIRRVVESWATELDWSRVLEQVRLVKAEPFVFAALSWAKSLYQAPVPAGILQALADECPPDLVAHVQATDSSALFRRTQQPPLVSLRHRLIRGVQDRRDAARWAGSPGEKWRVWQSALAFHRTDTASLLAGRRLKVEI
jgi:hypothetical protein